MKSMKDSMNAACPARSTASLPVLLAVAALFATTPLHAQYKVVGPDGKVTYTDRPPASGKVSELGARGAAAAESTALPLELRQPAARYPVTLYASTGACDPCESARQLLRRRGIPYSEKSLQSPEDADALERLSGGRDSPTLSIGSQTLRGLAPEVWNSYLDAAGYPRESRLPANYQYAPATPLVARAAPPRPAAEAPAEQVQRPAA
ncbi:MAG TPA: glutaredoxin family protein, partial [Burkholderiaceae bacterium]|nr:glutaredoxin family protein [Burkholderiaceae bacterium]